jgi:hypothetical protein
MCEKDFFRIRMRRIFKDSKDLDVMTLRRFQVITSKSLISLISLKILPHPNSNAKVRLNEGVTVT